MAPVGPSWLERAKCHLPRPAGSMQRGFPIQVSLTVADEANASQAAKEEHSSIPEPQERVRNCDCNVFRSTSMLHPVIS